MLGLDRDRFDAMYASALGELVRQLNRLQAAEAAAAVAEAARERLDAALIDAAEQGVLDAGDPGQRARQVVEAFRAASTAILSRASDSRGPSASIGPGDATLVFQPVPSLEDAVRLQDALAALPGITDVRISHFSDGVCMIRLRVPGPDPLVLDNAIMQPLGYPVPQPVTGEPAARIFLSDQEAQA